MIGGLRELMELQKADLLRAHLLSARRTSLICYHHGSSRLPCRCSPDTVSLTQIMFEEEQVTEIASNSMPIETIVAAKSICN